MDAFQWTPLFETGLAEVDAQHQRLVGLINQLSHDADSGSPEHIDQALQVLADYTIYHFRCEEAIMEGSQVVESFASRHRELHRAFLQQIGEWLEMRKRGQGISLHQLLDFLANWLTFHILGEDQSLCRQVSAIRVGVSPQTACDQDSTSVDPRTQILLAALHRLYGGLVARNEELISSQHSLSMLNATLEQRIAERTSELKNAQQEMLQASRLACVGQLAAGIAHEINTPIQYVGDNLRFIADSLKQFDKAIHGIKEMVELKKIGGETAAEILQIFNDSDLSYLLEEIPLATTQSLEGVEHVSKIVHSMKEFSHPGTTAKVATDINRAIGSTITVSTNEWKRIARLETDLAPDLPFVLCFPAEVNQVFLNLIINAAHAIESLGNPELGTIKIATRQVGDWLEVRVSDTGPGVPKEIRDKIYDPFFTTKEVGKGTGQGLAISLDVIVNKHKGKLYLDEEQDVGATFVVRLPLESQEA